MVAIRNESNYDYHFIIKVLTWKLNYLFKKKKKEKYKTFSVPIKKQVARIDKNGEKLEKPYPRGYNLLIAQDLLQAHFRILSIMFFKEIIKLLIIWIQW